MFIPSSRLVLVLGVFPLVMQLFFLGELLPLFFVQVGFGAPFLADDFGDFRVGETRVVGDDAGLVVLAVEDECWLREGISVGV